MYAMLWCLDLKLLEKLTGSVLTLGDTSRKAILLLWVVDPVGTKQLFHRGWVSDIYIMIRNSKTTFMK